MKASVLKLKKQVQRGFTLVEIAIVLVIIGLLIGGILRGQELINTARVKSLTDTQSAMQTAYYGFFDRFKLIPGDLTATQAALVNAFAVANSVDHASTTPSGAVTLADSASFFNNVAQAGFISCNQCMNPMGATIALPNPTNTFVACSSTSCPINVYSGVMSFAYVSTQAGALVSPAYFLTTVAGELMKPMIITGGSIGTNILAEMDRKIDDGNPATGIFRYTDVVAGTVPAGTTGAISSATALCANTANQAWVVATISQCQGASFF